MRIRELVMIILLILFTIVIIYLAMNMGSKEEEISRLKVEIDKQDKRYRRMLQDPEELEKKMEERRKRREERGAHKKSNGWNLNNIVNQVGSVVSSLSNDTSATGNTVKSDTSDRSNISGNKNTGLKTDTKDATSDLMGTLSNIGNMASSFISSLNGPEDSKVRSSSRSNTIDKGPKNPVTPVVTPADAFEPIPRKSTLHSKSQRKTKSQVDFTPIPKSKSKRPKSRVRFSDIVEEKETETHKNIEMPDLEPVPLRNSNIDPFDVLNMDIENMEYDDETDLKDVKKDLKRSRSKMDQFQDKLDDIGTQEIDIDQCANHKDKLLRDLETLDPLEDHKLHMETKDKIDRIDKMIELKERSQGLQRRIDSMSKTMDDTLDVIDTVHSLPSITSKHMQVDKHRNKKQLHTAMAAIYGDPSEFNSDILEEAIDDAIVNKDSILDPISAIASATGIFGDLDSNEIRNSLEDGYNIGIQIFGAFANGSLDDVIDQSTIEHKRDKSTKSTVEVEDVTPLMIGNRT